MNTLATLLIVLGLFPAIGLIAMLVINNRHNLMVIRCTGRS